MSDSALESQHRLAAKEQKAITYSTRTAFLELFEPLKAHLWECDALVYTQLVSWLDMPRYGSLYVSCSVRDIARRVDRTPEAVNKSLKRLRLLGIIDSFKQNTDQRAEFGHYLIYENLAEWAKLSVIDEVGFGKKMREFLSKFTEQKDPVYLVSSTESRIKKAKRNGHLAGQGLWLTRLYIFNKLNIKYIDARKRRSADINFGISFTRQKFEPRGVGEHILATHFPHAFAIESYASAILSVVPRTVVKHPDGEFMSLMYPTSTSGVGVTLLHAVAVYARKIIEFSDIRKSVTEAPITARSDEPKKKNSWGSNSFSKKTKKDTPAEPAKVSSRDKPRYDFEREAITLADVERDGIVTARHFEIGWREIYKSVYFEEYEAFTNRDYGSISSLLKRTSPKQLLAVVQFAMHNWRRIRAQKFYWMTDEGKGRGAPKVPALGFFSRFFTDIADLYRSKTFREKAKAQIEISQNAEELIKLIGLENGLDRTSAAEKAVSYLLSRDKQENIRFLINKQVAKEVDAERKRLEKIYENKPSIDAKPLQDEIEMQKSEIEFLTKENDRLRNEQEGVRPYSELTEEEKEYIFFNIDRTEYVRAYGLPPAEWQRADDIIKADEKAKKEKEQEEKDAIPDDLAFLWDE